MAVTHFHTKTTRKNMVKPAFIYSNENIQLAIPSQLLTIKSICVARHLTDVYLLATASDFSSGESWGYMKFYKLSELVRTWEQL